MYSLHNAVLRVTPPPPPEEAVSVLKKNRALYDTVMVLGGLVQVWVFWGGLGCFNGPHDGYANS